VGSDDAQHRRYNRYYARFEQPDPSDSSYDLTDPQSFNRYAYVQNDPVNFIDPSGLELEGGPPRSPYGSDGCYVVLRDGIFAGYYGNCGGGDGGSTGGGGGQWYGPPIDADAIRADLQRRLSPDCEKFLRDLINRVSRNNRDNPLVEGGDVLKIFDLINSPAQGGIVRAGGPGSKPGGTQANGSIAGGKAQIQLGVYWTPPMPTAEGVRLVDGQAALDETLHHAGEYVYYDYDYALAISQMPGMPGLPKFTGDPRSEENKWRFSNYFHPKVHDRCK
jgi:RHS repeat-associated protein